MWTGFDHICGKSVGMADTRRRMLTLLSLLQTGRAWSGSDLAERLETSPRTLRRDISRLTELGYPVETRPGPGGHYRLVAGTAMPPLLLDDEEAVAVAVGLRLAGGASPPYAASPEYDASRGYDARPGSRAGRGYGADGAGGAGDDAAGRALRKLEQVLPTRLRHRVAAIHATTEAAPGSRPAVSADVLATIASAAQRRERLRFGYRSRRDETGIRRVEPYRQVLARRRWYLLGWDLDRDDWRTFRVDRIGDVTPTGERFTPRDLPAETAADYLDANLKAARHRAVIVFHAPAGRVADVLVGSDGTLEPLDDERCRYTTWVDSFEWLAVTTAILGIDFEIREPAGFVAYCRELRDRLDRAAFSRNPLTVHRRDTDA
jgi:predicted DNA-binding transcriptional regulator YafY